MLSGRPEEMVPQRDTDHSERNSLVEDLCGNGPETGKIFDT
jgi:hypothetical protein